MSEVERYGGPGQAAKLSTLAERINEKHRAHDAAVKAALGQMSAALEHALDAGDLLTEAKAEVGHRNWLPWVDANFDGSRRRAQEYMYIAERRARIEEESKARHGAFSSIRAALDFLRRTRYAGGGWFQQQSMLPPPSVEKELTPAEERRQRAEERREQRLNVRAEYAIRTGNLDLPADVRAHTEWDEAINRALSLRGQNIPNVIDALGHQFDILVNNADPEEVGRHLAEPTNDYDEAEARSAMLAELREGVAWLERVLEEAEASEVTRRGTEPQGDAGEYG